MRKRFIHGVVSLAGSLLLLMTIQRPQTTTMASSTSQATTKNLLLLDPELVAEILEFPGDFRDQAEETLCQRMVEELTEEEQEIAACTSYAYWVASISHSDCPSADTRKRMAMKEARRHLIAEKGVYKFALDRLRETLRIRKERKLDLLRLCFREDAATFLENMDDRKMLARWEELIVEEMNKQLTWVQGYDRYGRAILHRSSRSSAEAESEAYYLAMLYFAEKAFACTEVFSRGRKHTILIVLDYGNYQSDKVPAMSLVQESIQMLQKIYPDRGEKVFVLDPPFWINLVHLVIRPFLAKETREKVSMVSGGKQRIKKIGALVDNGQATTAMLENGELSPYPPFDRLLYTLSFHSA